MLFPVLCIFGAVYCLGGIHGLLLAWSQPARMRAWARWVDCAADAVLVEMDNVRAAKAARKGPPVAPPDEAAS